jgi:hypothetical protein
MYITDKKGNKAEALDLILQKQFAYEILKGTKTIEFRKYSKHYISRFLQNSKEILAGKSDLEYSPKRIPFIHFHDYNATWFLDVAIKSCDLMPMSKSSVKYLHDNGCFEMDDLIAENESKGLKPSDKEMVWAFCLPIFAIINTSLDCSNIQVFRTMDIPERYVVK